jgi:hypothetical protein
MRLSAILVLLSVLFIPNSASAQFGPASIGCDKAIEELCWVQLFGRCGHSNPRIAIPACRRKIADQILHPGGFKPGRGRMALAQQYSLRGTAYLKLGNVDDALADYDRALKVNGELFWIHLARAAVLFAIADDQGALVSFNDAVSQAPNSAVALNERARLLATATDENVRNGQQAVADARRASELAAPGWPDNVAVLASAYAENGEFENAIQTQQRAIDLLEPGNQDAIRYLSEPARSLYAGHAISQRVHSMRTRRWIRSDK